MEPNQRFSILTFPQYFDGSELNVNIVVLPRDQNPLKGAISAEAAIPDAPAFADAEFNFTAAIFDDVSVFPHNYAPITGVPLPVDEPDDPRAVFQALAAQLQITNLDYTNRNVDLASLSKDSKPPDPKPLDMTVKKYLPRTYREAFNFTRPRNANMVTDDSYHCAIRDGQKDPTFTRDGNAVSWGQVFAYLMRQPFIATKAGMIYESSFTVQADHFPDGGWLYVDLSPDSDYREQLDADHRFIQRYAARIPRLVPGEPRQVFAAVQFPVRYKATPGDPDLTPKGYDRLFVEAADYDDGFAKIVHCRQPVNRDMLEEHADGNYPVKDVGFSLGWDDEEITERYIRQLLDDPSLGGRIDAPLGVHGFAVDVRRAGAVQWESLNRVVSRVPLTVANPATGDAVLLGNFDGELPYQVYPVLVDGRKNGPYWLPMYFANWNGHSMVLPDQDAADIYRTNDGNVKEDPLNPADNTGTGAAKGGAPNKLNDIYWPRPIQTELRYGGDFEFRVRMMDLSGGVPDRSRSPIDETLSYKARKRFRRYISPNQPRIAQTQIGADDDVANSDSPTAIKELTLRRPKLGYPAVVFTGKYSDPVDRLKNASDTAADPDSDPEHHEGLGIADPDVDRIEITVEVASVKLDKLDSVSGREDYVFLYRTTRPFPAVADDDGYEATLTVPIHYHDVHVLRTGEDMDLQTDLGLDGDIDDLDEIVLPTARTVRLTLRALAEDKDENKDYYGVIDNDNPLLDNRFGETVQLLAHKPSTDETELLFDPADAPRIQGIYLQPDLVTATDGKLTTMLLGSAETVQRDNVAQLAGQIGMRSAGLTLNGAKGQRVVFGCTSAIRHTLAPDGSSITFSSKGDLINHWIVALSFDVNRDWMWDAVANRSFIVRRTKKFTHDAAAAETDVIVGDVSVVHTASFEALENPHRDSWRIVFLDAVEPKKPKPADADEPGIPDTIELDYTVETQFKPDHGDDHDDAVALDLELPITTPPTQVPKIASAGLALSPYWRSPDYSETRVRQRYLWIEFTEPIKDPQDTYFARVLAVAPDQLLSNNHPELLRAPEEPVLPIDPEYIRVVQPNPTHDAAGLDAMQPMTKSTTSDRHYLMPVPPGLHAEADEMFGFFTYELRVGHYRHPDDGTMVWCTAPGRFGRRLRATGIQHPAPTLMCMANRDRAKVWVTAPYAVAVHDGRNVTADPPRTELWALLYAQVKQADNKDFRNILLGDRRLDWRVTVEREPDVDIVGRYTEVQRDVLTKVASQSVKYAADGGISANKLKLVDYETKNKDATRYGTVVWTQKEVHALLKSVGLQVTSPLSVLVVETLPQITNIYEHVSHLDEARIAAAASMVSRIYDPQTFHLGVKDAALRSLDVERRPSPLSDRLGHQRLLRTSPLTPVPPAC
ncbi:hypothetical protein ACGFK1_24300 [Mycobacterium sp. NPDC048908]|uniref:hypothetical protein n=1 Tax=Mycobacterium sp. NPDC048908 TaxID=3364292 RepID=UPI00371CA164